MCCYNYLIIFTPHSFRKLKTDFMSKLRRDLPFSKALVSMVCYNAVFFIKLLLYDYELISCYGRSAIYSRYKELLFCFVSICSIMHNIGQVLKTAFVPPRVGSLLFVSRIIKRTFHSPSNRPYLCYCHFSSHSCGVRNSFSISS